MDAPFGVYPTSDGWVTIAMSPYRKLIGVLGAPDLLAYDDPRTLFDKRDEIWEKIAARDPKWTKADLLEAMLAVDIWCGEVKSHLEVVDDPQVRHRGIITSYEHPRAGHGEGGRAGGAAQRHAAVDRPAGADRRPAQRGDPARVRHRRGGDRRPAGAKTDRAGRGLTAAVMATVVCCGAATLDTLFRVARLPTGPGKILPTAVLEVAHGMATSAAAAVARLGGRARLFARVGDDAGGGRFIDDLAAEGVDCRFVRRIPGCGRRSVPC